LRQIAANSLPPFAVFLPPRFAPLFPQRFRWEMVSNQMNGFPIPESRQKFYSNERIVFRLMAVIVQVLRRMGLAFMAGLVRLIVHTWRGRFPAKAFFL
jgi:hypothetical protein